MPGRPVAVICARQDHFQTSTTASGNLNWTKSTDRQICDGGATAEDEAPGWTNIFRLEVIAEVVVHARNTDW